MLAPRDQVWPPDYDAIIDDRERRLIDLRTDKDYLEGALAEYATDPVLFIEDWCDTFDPRNAGTDKPTRMPFVLFKRQREFLQFLHLCSTTGTNGLVEKSRDMGATWLCVCYSVWSFLFVPGSNIGWGSRKAANVDRLGDMSSIFEKIRWQLRSVPFEFWPAGFDDSMMNHMRVTAPNGNSINGESGDDIGRGGRTSMYFKDESAHYEHPEFIEAALGDNTKVQIDISSVNGLGNVFHRRREAGVEWLPGEPVAQGSTNVFIMDWTDHPAKTQSWYDKREATAIDEGLLHLFRQEVDRDYASSVEGVIIPAQWVKSAIDAHLKLEMRVGTHRFGGLDVADEGGDRNALALRTGVVLNSIEEWGDRDVGASTRRAIGYIGDKRIKIQYDSIGVGAGVKAEVNRLNDDKLMPKGVQFISWNAGAAVVNPDERVEDVHDGEVPTNNEFFTNLKAQAWWSVRRRFEKTHRAITEGIKFNHDELISIPSTLPKLRTLQKELSQPTAKKSVRLKLMVDKKPDGTRSPNMADALVMCYFPVENSGYDASLSWV